MKSRPGQAGSVARNSAITQNQLKAPLSVIITGTLILIWYCWIPTWYHDYIYSFYTKGSKIQLLNLLAIPKMLSYVSLNAVIKGNLIYVLWALAIFAGAFALGDLGLRALKLADRIEGYVFRALGLGLGIYSHLLLILGLLGLWFPLTMKLLIALPIFGGLFCRRRSFLEWLQRTSFRGLIRGFPRWDIVAYGILAGYLVMNISAALGPEFYYDSLVYHLAMPKLYLLHHRIVPTPTMLYSGIPFGMEMLYGLGLGIADERLAKLIQCGFGIVTAAAIFGWCRSRMQQHAALLAALLYYCTPMVFFESGVAKVELACALYTLLAVFAMLEAQEEQVKDEKYKLLALSGIFAGLSVSTKYNAGLYMLALPLPLIYQWIKGGRMKRVLGAELGVFFASAITIASPWFLKNVIFYHNPIYPFLGLLFGNNPSVNVSGLASDAGARNLLHVVTTFDGAKDFFVGIWNPVWPLDNVFGIVFQILLPWIFLVRPKSARQISMTLTMGGIWLAWALHTRMPRFLLPALPLFAILAAEALFSTTLPLLLRRLTIAIVYYTFILSLGGAAFVWYSQGLWRVSFKFLDRDSYLLHPRDSYMWPYYAGVKFINENTPIDAQVLFVGEERGFYCERKFITASVFDANPIIGLAESAKDGSALLDKLKGRGISYLLINRAAPRYYETIKAMNTSGRSAYETLLTKHARLIFDDRHDSNPNDLSWVQVYSLAEV